MLLLTSLLICTLLVLKNEIILLLFCIAEMQARWDSASTMKQAANVDCMARVNAKNPQRSLHVLYEGHAFAKPCETQVWQMLYSLLIRCQLEVLVRLMWMLSCVTGTSATCCLLRLLLLDVVHYYKLLFDFLRLSTCMHFSCRIPICLIIHVL